MPDQLDDPPGYVVTEIVKQPGGIWHVTVQMPDRKLRRLIVSDAVATVLTVQMAAKVVGILYGTEA